MRIIWSANAPWSTTGYGVQGMPFVTRMQRLGHEVAIFAWYGLQGGIMNLGDIPVLPAGYQPFGADVIHSHVKWFNADLVISLQDIWALPPDYVERCRPAKWACWFPIDHEPPPGVVIEMAQTPDFPIVYSHAGALAARLAGVSKVRYIPLGIDPTVFKPGDKIAARQRMGIPEDVFLVSMVAANKGTAPVRKAFAENFTAFRRFLHSHSDSMLYLHTLVSDATHGIDILKLIEACEIPRDRVRFCDQYSYAMGIPAVDVANIYQASDVLLAASMSEGFGIPIVEAQACGCPVITTQWTSMPEITFNGICTVPYQRYWTPMDSWVAIPDVTRLTSALSMIAHRTPEEIRMRAATGRDAMLSRYAWDVVIEEHWVPLLQEVEEALAYDREHLCEVGCREVAKADLAV